VRFLSRSACPLRWLGSASELVLFVFEQDVERGKRSVTARDILLQFEVVRFARFVRSDTAKAQADFEAASPAIDDSLRTRSTVSEILASPKTKTVYK
jgi:hypothetical protein